MSERTYRVSDTEAVAALIWMSFVASEGVPPLDDDGRAYISFKRALELYADTREREEAEAAALREWDAYQEEKTAMESESDTGALPHTEDTAQASDVELQPEATTAAQPPDTHTHTHTAGSAREK